MKLSGKYEIDYENSLGSGSFATVYPCTKKGEKDKKYAVKIVANNPAKRYIIEHEKESAEFLKYSQHPNLMYVDDLEATKDRLYIYMRYYTGGTLEDYISGKVFLGICEISKIFGQIVEGLAFLHDHKVAHRDMKHENIFLDKKEDGEYTAVIGDLGLARKMEGFMETRVGTPVTMSPELMRGMTYSSAADIWALGTMLYKMCFRFYPFEKPGKDMAALIKEGAYTFPKGFLVNVNCLQVIYKCLAWEPKYRPPAKELQKEPICKKGAAWDKMEMVWIKEEFTANKKEWTKEMKDLVAWLNDKKCCEKIDPAKLSH